MFETRTRAAPGLLREETAPQTELLEVIVRKLDAIERTQYSDSGRFGRVPLGRIARASRRR